MDMSFQSWKPGTEEFVPHHVLAEYIQDSAVSKSIMDCIRLNSRINDIRKVGRVWELKIAELIESKDILTLSNSIRVRSIQDQERC